MNQNKLWIMTTSHWTNEMWKQWVSASMDGRIKSLNRLLCRATVAWPYELDPSLSTSWKWLYENDFDMWDDVTVAVDYFKWRSKPFLFQSEKIRNSKEGPGYSPLPDNFTLPTCNDPKPAPRKKKDSGQLNLLGEVHNGE